VVQELRALLSGFALEISALTRVREHEPVTRMESTSIGQTLNLIGQTLNLIGQKTMKFCPMLVYTTTITGQKTSKK
jgi:hypothetical protein